jgi:hypothetical protein
MNDHPILSTDASQFPGWGAVWIALPVHGHHHRGHLGILHWQCLMAVSQQLVQYQFAHQLTTQAKAASGFNVCVDAQNRQPLIQYP